MQETRPENSGLLAEIKTQDPHKTHESRLKLLTVLLVLVNYLVKKEMGAFIFASSHPTSN
jgi:hypothetical protein